MNHCNLQEVIYESETMDLDETNEEENWEVERHLLKQQIKELESALNKSKKFHQKFVEDVIQTEEIRNQEFDREKKDLIALNKRQNAQIRELMKDKCFYESTCTALLKENEMSCNSVSQSAEPQKSMPPSKRSKTRTPQLKRSGSESKFKISTKLFHDNKKLKEEKAKLSKSNTGLRLQVKKLENFKKKIESRKEQQAADQQAMDGLLISTRRTNSQIFNASVLSRLDQFNRMQPTLVVPPDDI